LWLWPDSHLSFVFIASILAAAAVPVIWIGLSSETGALVGGGLNLCLMSGATAVYLIQLYAARGLQPLLIAAILFAVFAVLSAVILLWGRRHPIGIKLRKNMVISKYHQGENHV
jgi:hypothetical protein